MSLRCKCLGMWLLELRYLFSALSDDMVSSSRYLTFLWCHFERVTVVAGDIVMISRVSDEACIYVTITPYQCQAFHPILSKDDRLRGNPFDITRTVTRLKSVISITSSMNRTNWWIRRDIATGISLHINSNVVAIGTRMQINDIGPVELAGACD